MIIDTVMLHRKDDPSHEFREIILYQSDRHFAVWEVIGSLKDDLGVRRRHQVAIGWESDMRDQFNAEIGRLQAEGFTKLGNAKPEPL